MARPVTLDDLIDFAIRENIPFTADLFTTTSFAPDVPRIPVEAISGGRPSEEARIVIRAL